ncbi:MAG: DUF1801 domain-containing protein [Anaerolineales bacterium]|nr:DUF1801 domain-containing protein [Anaerolineales bacterium]
MTDLPTIFEALKPLLRAYQPPLTAQVDTPTRYELWSVKPLVIEGRKRKEVFFASLIIQKSYVGFYFMPVYIETELKTIFQPELLRLLKGKSCFHIKKLDEALLGQIEAALKTGFELYQQRGWI